MQRRYHLKLPVLVTALGFFREALRELSPVLASACDGTGIEADFERLSVSSLHCLPVLVTALESKHFILCGNHSISLLVHPSMPPDATVKRKLLYAKLSECTRSSMHTLSLLLASACNGTGIEALSVLVTALGFFREALHGFSPLLASACDGTGIEAVFERLSVSSLPCLPVLVTALESKHCQCL